MKTVTLELNEQESAYLEYVLNKELVVTIMRDEAYPKVQLPGFYEKLNDWQKRLIDSERFLNKVMDVIKL